MKNNNLLIIGGSGSIGTAITENNDFDHIYVLDKQIQKKSTNKITYLKCDLLNSNLLEKIFLKLPSNLFVIYLAGNLTMEFHSINVQKSFNDNVIALSNFLNLFNSKLNHVVLVSSISVYGKPLRSPIKENHPIQPFSLYGCAKASSEIICKALCQNYKIPLTILRLTQLYGLQSAHETFPHILLNAIKSKDLSKLKVDPRIERDYLHVSDFVNFLKILIKHPKEGIFNIGTGKGRNLMSLVQSFADLYQIDLEESNSTVNSSFSQVMDISLAKKIFGFKPTQKIESWLKNEL